MISINDCGVIECYDLETKAGDRYLHRIDGPAVIHPNGYQEWWYFGRKHHDKGPAVIYPSGRQEWWCLGKLDRKDGPAITYSNYSNNGKKIDCYDWYADGKLHNLHGPAQKDGVSYGWANKGCSHKITLQSNGINIFGVIKKSVEDWNSYFEELGFATLELGFASLESLSEFNQESGNLCVKWEQLKSQYKEYEVNNK